MKLEQYNPELIEEDSYAWRYMKFNRLLDFLTNNQLYFTRLDQFDDEIEGLENKIWEKLTMLRYYEQPNVRYKPTITKPTRHEIISWQEGSYASCWFLTEQKTINEDRHHESLAMWEHYGKDGFTFCIKFSLLKAIISQALKKFNDEEICRARFGKIQYLTFFNDAIKQTESTKYRALVKQAHFRHENEVRFNLERDQLMSTINRKGIKLQIKLPLDDTNKLIRIIAHPDMDWNNFEIYSTKLYNLKYNLSPSLILTKKNTEHLISD